MQLASKGVPPPRMTPCVPPVWPAGRFEDDVAAAKAYDKAAVYLYGSNAITNFGLEACQVDPTEVRAQTTAAAPSPAPELP